MFGLTLLLTTAATALDQLCLSRMQRDLGVLTPEYLDPSLHLSLEGAACSDECAARQRLGQVRQQLLAVGPVASTHAILEQGSAGRRQTALLALAGAGSWQSICRFAGGVELHRRTAANGHVFILASAPATPAAHAPHAMLSFAERLWLLPATHPAADGTDLPTEAPLLRSDGAPDSLSLAAALLNLMAELRMAGADALADQVATLSSTASIPEAWTQRPQRRPTPAAA